MKTKADSSLEIVGFVKAKVRMKLDEATQAAHEVNWGRPVRRDLRVLGSSKAERLHLLGRRRPATSARLTNRPCPSSVLLGMGIRGGPLRNRRTGRAIGAMLVIAVVGAACAKSAPTSGGSLTPAGGSTQSGGQMTTPPSTLPASPAVIALTLQQGAGGFVFSPSTFEVKQGEAITVSNVGTVPHTFTVQGQNINVVNSPGQSTDVTIDLAPGVYPFICSFHVQLGMMGTLTVTG
jgi:plastocyanin